MRRGNHCDNTVERIQHLMKYAYVIGVTTSGYPDGVIAAPTLGCFSAEKNAHDYIDLLKQDRKFRGGTILCDNPCQWRVNGDEVRRVIIDKIEHGGCRETLTIVKYKLR